MNIKLCIAFLSLGFFSAFAQTKVSGHVFSENNEPIPFANVLFKGSTIGTITNEDGKFYLEADKNWDTLIVSFLGFERLEIPITKRVNYDLKFILKEETSSLNEVSLLRHSKPGQVVR